MSAGAIEHTPPLLYVGEVEIAGEWLPLPKTAACNRRSCEALLFTEAHATKAKRITVYVPQEGGDQ